MNLSEHFTLKEFLRSSTADKYKIKNVALERHIENMKILCEKFLEPIRTIVNEISIDEELVIVTSVYRSRLLNKTMELSGYFVSKNSDHMTGMAADIICKNFSNKQIAKLIIGHGLKFKQCIIESSNNRLHAVFSALAA